MTSQRNTGAFVVGSVIGGLVGAAVTLWTTPKSGAELRADISASREDGDVVTFRPGDDGIAREQRFSNPVLSLVEKAAAPIVGVELGKLARDDPDAMTTAPIRQSSADAQAPTPAGVHPVAGEPVEVPPSGATPRAPEAQGAAGTSPTSPYTSAAATGNPDEGVVNPGEEATHDSEEGSSAHAATTEDLTHPTPEYAEELDEKLTDEGPAKTSAEFPDLPSNRETADNR